MLPLEKSSDTFDKDEFRAQVELLVEADWIQIEGSASYLSRGLNINYKELLSEAFCRALEGDRKCPKTLPVPIFMYGVIRSLVSDYLKKRKRDTLHQAVEVDDEFWERLKLEKELDTPEEMLIAKQKMDEIYEAFKDDEVAQMIFMGNEDDYTPLEMQETLGISETQYQSALRAIRRKVHTLVNRGA